MVNQQLKDYINEQVRVGVSKDAIKGALLEAGWAEAEVSEAMGMSPAATMTPRVDAVAPMMAKPMQQKPVIAAASRMDAVAKPITIRTSPAVSTQQAKPVMQSQKMERPMIMNDMAMPAKPRGGHHVAEIIMGLLILVLGSAAVVFFLKYSGLQKDLGTAMGDRDGTNAQIAELKTENEALKADRAVLQGEKADLEAELRIFASTATGEEEVLIKGVLVGAEGKNVFALRTAHNAVITLKNSRLANIEATLAPLVGKEIAILGKHQVGSKDITILEVNGVSVGATATSTPASL